MLSPDNVFIAIKPVDMRRGIDALTQYIQDELRCVFRSIRSRIGIEVRSAIRIHSINRELNFFYR
ncbi:hypothetical protein NEO56_04290, partial [Escherichia coli]|nr:hypothetical protein [Escherichia coli]